MIHKSFITPKSDITTVTENTTIAQVNELFNSPEEAHTRTMPILDESGKLFRETFTNNTSMNTLQSKVI